MLVQQAIRIGERTVIAVWAGIVDGPCCPSLEGLANDDIVDGIND